MHENFGWVDALDWSKNDNFPKRCIDCGIEIKDSRSILCTSTHREEYICKSCFKKRLIRISQDFAIPGLEYRWKGKEKEFQKIQEIFREVLFHSDEDMISDDSEDEDEDEIWRADEQIIARYHLASSLNLFLVITDREIIIPSKNVCIDFGDIKSIGYNRESIKIIYHTIDYLKSREIKKPVYDDACCAEFPEIPYENRRVFCELLILLKYCFDEHGYGFCFSCNKQSDYGAYSGFQTPKTIEHDRAVIWDNQISDAKHDCINELLSKEKAIFYPAVNEDKIERNYILLCPSCYEQYVSGKVKKWSLDMAGREDEKTTHIHTLYPDIWICEQCRSAFFSSTFMEIKEPSKPVKLLCKECFQKAYPQSNGEDKLVQNVLSTEQDNQHGGEKMENKNQEKKDANPWAVLLASMESGAMTEAAKTHGGDVVTATETSKTEATETKNSWAELLAVAEHGVNKDGKVENLDALLDELNSLIGLSAVKEEIHSLINIIQINNRRKSLGIAVVPMSKHLVFSGNPGTGKTTVARLLAKIYGKLDILSKGHLIEVDRAGLVAGYVGQTATKTLEVIQKALGGILFIDEAYSLTVGKGDTDYGFEAVDTLLKAMEDHRDDLVVVVAGYPEQMDEFLESNPGLRSRFNTFIHFEDYKPDELLDIFRLSCRNNHYRMGAGLEEHLSVFFTDMYEHRGKDFANGREVRNIFEKAITRQANRLAQTDNLDDEALVTLEVVDF